MPADPQSEPNGGDPFLRRALVAAAAAAGRLSDLQDAAALALALGYHGVARRLWETTFVIGGFSPAMRRRQRDVARRTGWWKEIAGSNDSAALGRHRSAIVLALEEIRALADLPCRARPVPPPSRSVAASDLMEACQAAPAGSEPCIAVDLPTRLFVALGTGDAELVDDIMTEAHPLIVAPALSITDVDPGMSLEELANAVIAGRFQAFFRQHHALCWSSIGSAERFTAAARLSDNGLGAYMGNVQKVARSLRDVFGLAWMATQGTADLEPWLLALAAPIDRDALVQLADDAGDHGMMEVLEGLLSAERRRGGGNRELVRVIRDAALDHADLALAGNAQLQLVRSRTADPIEWLALGEIIATAGDEDLAIQAFRQGLAQLPSNPLLRERLAAVQEHRFEAYATRHGFGSSPMRVALRRRRRSARGAD